MWGLAAPALLSLYLTRGASCDHTDHPHMHTHLHATLHPQQNGFLTFLDWLVLCVLELIVAGFLLHFGRSLADRLRNTVMFNNQRRRQMIRRLNGILTIITLCLVTEIVGRCIGTMPLFYSNWDSRKHPEIYQILQNPVLWQFVAYILPCDVVAYCLLYLMRTPPPQTKGQVIHGKGGGNGAPAHHQKVHHQPNDMAPARAQTRDPTLTKELLKEDMYGDAYRGDTLSGNSVEPVDWTMADAYENSLVAEFGPFANDHEIYDAYRTYGLLASESSDCGDDVSITESEEFH